MSTYGKSHEWWQQPGRHMGGPPQHLWAGEGEHGVGKGPHFGLAQQLLELGLRQEAVVLHEGWDLGRPLALVVHGAVDLHVLAQDAQELLLPLQEREAEGSRTPSWKADQQRTGPWPGGQKMWGGSQVGH